MLKLLPTLLRSASAISPGLKPRSLLGRARFVAKGLKHQQLIRPLIESPENSSLGAIVRERPDMLGVLVWPYVNAAWGPAARIQHVVDHYAHLDQIGKPYPFSIDERLVLVDMQENYPGLRLVLDQPKWFRREGGLTLNLFIDQFRAYSVAFNYSTDNDGSRAIIIGSLQGRNTEDSLDLYRSLTKAMHGMRPRDLLIHALRIIAQVTDTSRMYGITNAYRHHQHAYFGAKAIVGDYDPIWEDRGGKKIDDQFFELPIASDPRDISTVKPKKRSLYRKRFAFLEGFDTSLAKNFTECTPVRFVDL
jgi:uncharacterized protein VirK/YbjX